MDKEKIRSAALNDHKLLEVLIPGRGSAIQTIRNQIISFARNSSARGALLIGPIGSGKSTIARVMALMRYLYFSSEQVRKDFLGNLRFDGPFRIDKKLLTFYEELNLTGLVRELAQAQLFGVAKGAASGVSEKPGIFEQAMSGHGKPAKSSDMTGGVVFLDEIGDLPPELQPLLLSVLTGAEVHRVGDEGKFENGYAFNGVVIAATWKNPFDGLIRHDLLSRLASFVIRLPGLNQRKDEMDEIIREMANDIVETHKSRMAELERTGGTEVSRERIRTQSELKLNLDREIIDLLKKQAWEHLGDLRGLRQVLERAFHDQIPISKALEQSVSFNTARPEYTDGLARSMLEDILDRDNPNSLTEEIRRIEKQTREDFASNLLRDKSLSRLLADKLNVPESTLKRQLSDMTRDRSRKSK